MARIEEGQVWEAAMFAAHYKLDNLVAVVDNNGLQIDGKISEVMSPYPIDEKFKAFGWHVIASTVTTSTRSRLRSTRLRLFSTSPQ